MSDFLSRARETAEREAEREYPLPDDLSTTSRTLRMVAREHYANGWHDAVSRLPSEEEIGHAILGRTATSGARAVRELIEKKMLGETP
jgi:hypothetical protein